MVYRTPSPPPEELQEKKPFEIGSRHLFAACYLFAWLLCLIIYLGNRDKPSALYWTTGIFSGIHIVVLFLVGIDLNESGK